MLNPVISVGQKISPYRFCNEFMLVTLIHHFDQQKADFAVLCDNKNVSFTLIFKNYGFKSDFILLKHNQ